MNMRFIIQKSVSTIEVKMTAVNPLGEFDHHVSFVTIDNLTRKKNLSSIDLLNQQILGRTGVLILR